MKKSQDVKYSVKGMCFYFTYKYIHKTMHEIINNKAEFTSCVITASLAVLKCLLNDFNPCLELAWSGSNTPLLNVFLCLFGMLPPLLSDKYTVCVEVFGSAAS